MPYVRYKNITYELRDRIRETYVPANTDANLSDEDQAIESFELRYGDVYIGKVPEPKPDHDFAVIKFHDISWEFKRLGRRANTTLIYKVQSFIRIPADIAEMARLRLISEIYENITSTTAKITLGGNIQELKIPKAGDFFNTPDGWVGFTMTFEVEAHIV